MTNIYLFFILYPRNSGKKTAKSCAIRSWAIRSLRYYQSRIKCPLLVPETSIPWVTSKSPHTILKKQKIWGNFLFLIFSMVWGQFLTMPHKRSSWILGMKSGHCFGNTVQYAVLLAVGLKLTGGGYEVRSTFFPQKVCCCTAVCTEHRTVTIVSYKL